MGHVESHRNVAYVLFAGAIGLAICPAIARGVANGQSAATARFQSDLETVRSSVRNGPLTLFVDGAHGPNAGSSAIIQTVGPGISTTVWRCPGDTFCGEAVSFDWAPDGRRVAFTLDEIGGTSSYVGLHVVNTVSGRDRQIPAGAPGAADSQAWYPYLSKMLDRVGCWPAAELQWSPDGSRLAYRCGAGNGINAIGWAGRPHINVLELKGSGYRTIPTRSTAYWPSWSSTGTRIAYSTALRPMATSRIVAIALDGSHRRLLATGGSAPAWSPDGKTIAYQTRCGIRLVTPAGRDVTPLTGLNACGAIGPSSPPVWSPDGQKIAVETKNGVYVLDATGRHLIRVSDAATTTWYGALPGRPSWQAIH